MTQEERWNTQYKEIAQFIVTQERRPSKHRPEEHKMVNWLRHNRRLLARGEQPEDRAARMQRLLTIASLYRRKNQYAYTPSSSSDEEVEESPLP